MEIRLYFDHLISKMEFPINGHMTLTHWPLGDMTAILNEQFSNTLH